MQVLAILCCLVVSALSDTENRFKGPASINQESLEKFRSTPFGQKYLTDLTIWKNASVSDFSIYFYTRRNRNYPVVLRNNDVEGVVNSGFFNSSARIISVTHGWNNDYASEINHDLLDAILLNYDVNVFISDWGPLANSNYLTAVSAVPFIGDFLGDFFNKLVSKYEISHKQITLIGHSLGAHIAGAAGAISKDKVNFIIGLDPALPLVNPNPDSSLDTTDAEFVQIIHTSGGLLGYYNPIGHSDYYPNGGTVPQPGCILDLLGTCSHGRSHEYFTDSIINPKQKYWAYKCKNYASFKNKKCSDKEVSFLGTLEPDTTANGSYYLKTNSAPPYAIE